MSEPTLEVVRYFRNLASGDWYEATKGSSAVAFNTPAQVAADQFASSLGSVDLHAAIDLASTDPDPRTGTLVGSSQPADKPPRSVTEIAAADPRTVTHLELVRLVQSRRA